jgi:hypothetical protein
MLPPKDRSTDPLLPSVPWQHQIRFRFHVRTFVLYPTIIARVAKFLCRYLTLFQQTLLAVSLVGHLQVRRVFSQHFDQLRYCHRFLQLLNITYKFTKDRTTSPLLFVLRSPQLFFKLLNSLVRTIPAADFFFRPLIAGHKKHKPAASAAFLRAFTVVSI